jgi:hypothetical protein
MLLSDADKRMLVVAARQNGGFHLATQWYLRDFEPLPYQWAWHHLALPNTTFVAGIATGKTTIVAASYFIDCLTIPYFRALNTSVTAKQAELPFDMVMPWIEDNPRLEKFIENIVLRPYPVIQFKNFSQFEFRTAGTDARFIRGSEYDRINFDEAGLDYNGEIIKVLRGRLRGKRPDKTIRMARLDVTTSPTDAEWLIERFNRGIPTHHDFDSKYASMRVATWDNTHLTEEQVEAMRAEYPPELIDVEMGGEFPKFGVSMFPMMHIQACTDQALYDAAYLALNPESGRAKSGYRLTEDARHGIVLYEEPFIPGHLYVSGGDPGMDNYPSRNAGSVIVADVTEKPYRIAYFHWVSGNGSYNPFLASYKYAIDKYMPVLRGIDSTGPQAGMTEVAFTNAGIVTEKLQFNTNKQAMLNMLTMDISNHRMKFPPIRGLTHQLRTYTDENDRKGYPQDNVMALAEISYLANFVPEEASAAPAASANYRSRSARTNHKRSR